MNKQIYKQTINYVVVAKWQNKLLKKINPILTKYSIEREISIILQKKDLIIGKTELDITDKIITIINNEINEFKIK